MDTENKYNDIDDEELPLPAVDIDSLDTENPEAIPAPEEEEYLPDITVDDVIREMVETDERGFSRSIVQVELRKIDNFNPDYIDDEELEMIGSETMYEGVEPADLAEDNPGEFVDGMIIERSKINAYTLDGELENLILEFNNPLDKEMEELLGILDTYNRMVQEYMEAEPGTGSMPIFTIHFSPVEYPGQGVATYAQPSAYFKTLIDGEEDHRGVHIIFPKERFSVLTFRISAEERRAMEEYVVARTRKE